MSYTPVGWANDETHPLSQANMKTLDLGIVDVDGDLDDATSLATANRLVRRDGSGRARFVDPSNAADAATKGYVDAHSKVVLARSRTTGESTTGVVTLLESNSVPLSAGRIYELTGYARISSTSSGGIGDFVTLFVEIDAATRAIDRKRTESDSVAGAVMLHPRRLPFTVGSTGTFQVRLRAETAGSSIDVEASSAVPVTLAVLDHGTATGVIT